MKGSEINNTETVSISDGGRLTTEEFKKLCDGISVPPKQAFGDDVVVVLNKKMPPDSYMVVCGENMYNSLEVKC